MKSPKVNPSVTPLAAALARPKANVPALPKPPKAPKAAKTALAPLYGQKRQRPVIQSVPTRTPSF